MATIGLPTANTNGTPTGDNITYTQTLPAAPVAPSNSKITDYQDFNFLVRELVANDIVREPTLQKYITSARSFFTGNRLIQDNTMLANLKFGQQWIVNILKDQNPFDLYAKSEMTYNPIDTCHDQLQLDCTMPCINTVPEFDQLTFRFDTEYAYGVRACDKNKDFWPFEYFTEQYAKSRDAYLFGREVDLWNTVIEGLIAAPATTVDAKLAQQHPTHFWDNMGDIATTGRAAITQAYWYMQTAWDDINPTVFMTAEAAMALIRSVENPYNLNQNTQVVNTYKQWDVPGFMVDEQVRVILGSAAYVVIMQRSPWMTYSTGGGLVSNYPLWNNDATKMYVAILDPRVGYQFEKDGYHLTIVPYDCDHLYRGMQDTVYTGSGITFPQLGLVMEFDMVQYV